jgi:phage shock protein C
MDDRLYRSATDRMFTGVAGGLAERLDVDPALVRIVWAVSMPLTGFLTLLIYVVMALVVPEEPGYPMTGAAFAGGGPAGPPPGWGQPGGLAGAAGTQTPGASPPEGGTDTGTSSGSTPVSGAAGPAGEPSSAAAPGQPAAWAQDWRSQRATWRAQRRAERAEWRARRRTGNGAVVAGLLLIGLGILFLGQQLIPAFDWNVAWPIAVILLGLVLIAGSVRRGG